MSAEPTGTWDPTLTVLAVRLNHVDDIEAGGHLAPRQALRLPSRALLRAWRT